MPPPCDEAEAGDLVGDLGSVSTDRQPGGRAGLRKDHARKIEQDYRDDPVDRPEPLRLAVRAHHGDRKNEDAGDQKTLRALCEETPVSAGEMVQHPGEEDRDGAEPRREGEPQFAGVGDEERETAPAENESGELGRFRALPSAARSRTKQATAPSPRIDITAPEASRPAAMAVPIRAGAGIGVAVRIPTCAGNGISPQTLEKK